MPEFMRRRLPPASAFVPDSLGRKGGPKSLLVKRAESLHRIHERPEITFGDDLPDYVDWRTFVHSQGPGQSFAHWLGFLIPPGAEVVPIGADIPKHNEWPTDRYQIFGAPLIAEAAGVPYSRRRAERRLEVAERMPIAAYRVPGAHRPRKGVPMWRMKAAFFHDVFGYSTFAIAQLMDLKDDAARGESRSGDTSSSQGRRYVRAGRHALAQLGAWPWCLAEDGRIDAPKAWLDDRRIDEPWYRHQPFAEALASWHYQQTLSNLFAAFTCVSWSAGGRERFGNSATLDAARVAYHNLYVAMRKTSERATEEA